MDYELRDLKSEDLPALQSVYRDSADFLALGPGMIGPDEMAQQDFFTALERGRSLRGIFCAEQLVGVLDLFPSGFEGQPEVAFLELLMIGAAARGQKLGRRVVRQVEAELRAAGIKRLWLAVQVNNPLALHFWQGMGFAIVSGPTPQPDQTITWLMEKNI